MAKKKTSRAELPDAPFDVAPDASAAIFVVKVGPIEIEDGVVDAYLPIFPDGTVGRPELVDNAPAALATIAARERHRGLPYACAPEIALAGRKHGFAVAPIPKTGYEAMLAFSLMSSVPPQLGQLHVAADDAVELGRLSRALLEAAPWEHWGGDTPIDVRLYAPDGRTERLVATIIGESRELFGFGIYDAASFSRIVEESIETGEVTGLSLCLHAFHDAAVNAFRAAFATPFYPMPARAERGRMRPADTEEIFKLITIAKAIVQLSPKKLVARAELAFDNGAMVADVTAPEPSVPAPAPKRTRKAKKKTTRQLH